ncbi:2-amino-3-ketobutyrate coenzyme A ligase [Dethiosulfatibacter aminovorans DSM 17477]|uniref:2-amino-3-ketobutyrate coenzyme A ligase n=1 Tax=Dethiosulfatibacter aminovorans DSM 17477 TaxID=1121476 RepID=A0A1M6CDT3_9FIRM|nr:glycine C-acetyltransferase [Dethiosulfatibacter aminovorans]SHI59205.1 2-amino-3-ketobutyrate coenzyme A ligase [Dethiosulfatibacter aminovorans DSM 17477]
MYKNIRKVYEGKLNEIRESGLWKEERIIVSPQKSRIDTDKVSGVLNMCANNYLGLANNEEVRNAAKKSYDDWGYGLSSVRFICGTQSVHKALENKLSEFLGMEDTILYSSCFDANGGLFETILTENDAVISDELNHASIIDGVRLCKAKRYRYKNNNMEDLEEQLKQADKDGAEVKLIATDGVFSMDGIIADLKGICDLADKYDALVMVDDSHAVGFVGKKGRGTHEYNDVMDRVDIITGTLGKALGGASGGYTSGRKEIIDLLRQRSRPYLFSNTLAPAIANASLKVLEMLTESTEYRDKLEENTKYFRDNIKKLGFDIIDGVHPIVPIMLGDAVLSQKMSEMLLEKGVYVIGFYYPVVPKGKARIRTQISAAHSIEDLEFALNAFKEVKEELGI